MAQCLHIRLCSTLRRCVTLAISFTLNMLDSHHATKHFMWHYKHYGQVARDVTIALTEITIGDLNGRSVETTVNKLFVI